MGYSQVPFLENGNLPTVTKSQSRIVTNLNQSALFND